MDSELAAAGGLVALPADGGDPLRVLIVNSVLAAPDRDSGALRLFRIVETLLQEGHRVTFIARDGYRQERDVARLVAMGVDVFPLDFDRMRSLGAELVGDSFDLREILERGRFDLALISFFNVAEQYLPLIRAHSPLTRIVIDTVDVHHVRERRGAELSGNPAALAEAERTRRREETVYRAADGLIAVSETDSLELERLAPDVPRFVISNVHEQVGETPGFEPRHGLVFIGSFPHLPNVDAVLEFHRHVWPLVRAGLPGVTLTLVGTSPPPAVTALAAPDVEVAGWVPEVAPYLDAARVSIAPLRFGAGVKGKIGEALSRGLPVVTTSIGAEGMALADGEHALVADDPAAFAAAVIRLHEEPELWRRVGATGRAHIERTLGIEAARRAVRALLDGVVITPFVARAGTPAADRAVGAYADAFAPDARASLVLTVPPGDDAAAQAAFDRAAQTLTANAVALDAVADIQIAPTGADPILPARAVVVGEHAGSATLSPEAAPGAPSAGAAPRTLSPDAAPARWRELAAIAPPHRRPPLSPQTAVVVHAADDPAGLTAQLDALRAAGMPPRSELVIVADVASHETQTLLAAQTGARVLRATTALGRHQAWSHGAQITTADHVVALSPLALPQPGLVEALVDALRAGAAVAGPSVDGVPGLRIGPDGSLWPRAGDADGELGALALDCLAVGRELLAAGLPAFPRGEGHVEHQLARWAADRGGIALAPVAHVTRLAAPPASVLVCTRNRAEELPDGIALILAAGARDVVIVDNDSTDDTLAVATELAQRSGGRVRVVQEPRGGLCHARNAGAAAARHELLLYLDDDARIAPGWLQHLARGLSRPGVANAGGPISALWPESRRPGWPGRDLEPLLSVLDLADVERTLAPPHFVYGANWAVRRAALRAVGGFDPAFGPGPEARINGDEVSVAAHLHQRGLGRTLYVPDAAVGHRISPDRIDDRFMLHRALCVGVEKPRHAESLGRGGHEKLLTGARESAQRLFARHWLHGELTIAGALEQIAGVAAPLSDQVSAAMALGELAASVALLGEREAVFDAGLRLQIDTDALLRGVIAAPAPAAVAA